MPQRDSARKLSRRSFLGAVGAPLASDRRVGARSLALDAPISIDCDFPGGNIVVERTEGDHAYVHQDLRDTKGTWFHWLLRLRGAAGRAVVFHFTQSPAIGVRGPAVSVDAGQTWRWLGAESVERNGFRFVCPRDVDETRLGFAMPYVESNLRSFLQSYEASPHLAVEVLCHSRGGRPVERLRVGCINGAAEHRVLLTARHHACESMASFVLEGLMAAVLSDDELGRWLRRSVEFMVAPFVDKDGVENGDQGKNRRPHDHNRDYSGDSIYPEVAAIREQVPWWSQGRLRIALDLHCPYIRGDRNEVIYFVGLPDAEMWRRVQTFAAKLAEVRQGPLRCAPEDNLPFGKGWNTAANYAAGKSCSRWAAELPSVEIASTIEIPYANVRGAEVSAESARAFGRDIAAAIAAHFAQAQECVAG